MIVVQPGSQVSSALTGLKSSIFVMRICFPFFKSSDAKTSTGNIISVLLSFALLIIFFGIISDSECKHFIETSSKKVRRSLVSGFDQEKNKRGLLDNRRTSSSCWISHIHDEITQGLAERISELVNIPLSRAESFQVLHYADKQEYQPHLDTFDPSVKEYSHYLENGGQRILTAIGYLNDVIEGGETAFPNIKKKVQPKKGKIVVFDLCYKGTDKPHPDSVSYTHLTLPTNREV